MSSDDSKIHFDMSSPCMRLLSGNVFSEESLDNIRKWADERKKELKEIDERNGKIKSEINLKSRGKPKYIMHEGHWFKTYLNDEWGRKIKKWADERKKELKEMDDKNNHK